MPKFIEIPDVGSVAFPDEMPMEEITLAVRKIVSQQASQKLASGEFKEKVITETTQDSKTPTVGGAFVAAGIKPQKIDPKKTEENLLDTVSQALGVSKDQVDLKSGLPVSDRVFIDFISNPELKAEYVRQQYPNSSTPLVIDGEPAFAIQQDNGKTILSTNTGSAIENALAIGAGKVGREVLPTASAIAGGALAVKSGAGAVAAPIVAAGAYTLAGSVQDAIIQQITGIDEPAVQVFARRGKEAAIGIPIDYVTLGTGKFLSRRIGKNLVGETESAIDGAIARQAQQGRKFDIPGGYRFGELGMRTQQMLAASGNLFSKKLVRRLEKTQQQLFNIQKAMKDGLPDEAGVYQSTIASLKKEYDDIAGEIAGADQKTKKIILDNLNKRIDRLQVERPPREPVGRFFQENLFDAEQAANKIKSNSYTEFNSFANQQGLTVDPDEMAKIISSTRREMKGKRNPAIDKIESELRLRKENAKQLDTIKKSIQDGKLEVTPDVEEAIKNLEVSSGPLDYATMNAYIERVAKEVPSGGSTGEAIPKQVSDVTAAKLQQWRDGIFERDGMAGMWANARNTMNDRLAFETKTPAGIMREVFGENVVTPTQAVETIISDPTKARRILGLLRESTDREVAAQEPILRKQLQEIYLDEIGLGRMPGVETKQITGFNPEVARVLWGVDRRGNLNELAGQRIVQRIDYLNKAFADAKVPIKDVDPNDISAYFQTLDGTSRDQLAKTIVAKASAQDQLDKFTNNKIVDLALKGKWEFLDGDSLPKALISSGVSAKEVGRVLNKMPFEEKKVLADDFLREWFNTYSGGQTMSRAPFATFWNAKKFLKDVDVPKGQSDIVKKMNMILGKERTQEIIDLSRIVDATAFEKELTKDQIRSTVGLGGISFYAAQGIGSTTRNSFYAAMLGSGAMDRSGLLKLMAKDAGPEATEKAFQKAIKYTIGTRNGIDAISRIARNDPQFASEFQKISSDLRNSEEEAKQALDQQ